MATPWRGVIAEYADRLPIDDGDPVVTPPTGVPGVARGPVLAINGDRVLLAYLAGGTWWAQPLTLSGGAIGPPVALTAPSLVAGTGAGVGGVEAEPGIVQQHAGDARLRRKIGGIDPAMRPADDHPPLRLRPQPGDAVHDDKPVQHGRVPSP